MRFGLCHIISMGKRVAHFYRCVWHEPVISTGAKGAAERSIQNRFLRCAMLHIASVGMTTCKSELWTQ